MFSKKTLIKIVSLLLIILLCKTSVVIKKPALSRDNFLQVVENDKIVDFFNHQFASNPAIANSFGTNKSTLKSNAKDNSSSFLGNGIISAQNAEANSKNDSIASAIFTGSTNLDTEAIAKDKSNVNSQGRAFTFGETTANANEGSLAVAANKNDHINDNTIKAIDNSTANGGTISFSRGFATANASHGSLADIKANDTMKTNSDLSAEDKSFGSKYTLKESIIRNRADAENGSKAQSVAEATNKSDIDLKAVKSSNVLGELEVNSETNSNAKALNGGNAISTSESVNKRENIGTAENGSTIGVFNISGDNSSSNSNSEGTLHPLITVSHVVEKPFGAFTKPLSDSTSGNTVTSGPIAPGSTIVSTGVGAQLNSGNTTTVGEITPGLPLVVTTDKSEHSSVNIFSVEDIPPGTALAVTGYGDDMGEINDSITNPDKEFGIITSTIRNEQDEQFLEDKTPSCVFQTCPGKERCEMHCLENKDNGNFIRNEDTIRDDTDKSIGNETFLRGDEDRRQEIEGGESEISPTSVPHHVHKPCEKVACETIPKVDLKAAATHDFIDDNVNGIKHESAQHLNKIQHLLRNSKD